MNDATPHPTPDATPPEPDATEGTAGMLPVADAAAALGITSDAVRARIRRGKMYGEKRGGAWFVSVTDEDSRDTTPDSDATKPDTASQGHDIERDTRETVVSADATELPENTTAATGVATGPAVDMAPLAELIDDLTRRNADLAAAAAMWQTRAAHLEDQLKQLGAGRDASDATEAPESAPRNANTETYRALTQSAPEGFLARLRRWLGGNR